MDDETLGLAVIGYQAYGDAAGWKNYQGNPMPTWEELPEAIKSYWSAAALKIAQQTISNRVREDTYNG